MNAPAELNAVTFEVIRNRLVAIAEEMRIALQSVSGSPTVTEASDFFTGLFMPDGSVVSMGFQVSFQAPVSGTVIRHINGKPELNVRDGDMFIGNDPFIGALHQNDVQMIGPIYAGDRIIAWAGVQAHQTDVGGMDFASWCPKAKNVFQEGIRIPCVKLMDRGELREDVLEMITTASRLPDALGLDIRAFIATINVARNRVSDLVKRYGADVIDRAMQRMIASSEARARARLAELPDGVFHACDFLEHDGHNNVLYKVDCKITKHGDSLTLDYSGSSKQSPGFINATRAGLMGGACGSLLTTLAWDIQWNQGVLKTAEVIAPDGLICTAQFPAPVGSATVETIWVVSNATMLALNKLLATSPKYRHRTQTISDGCMATFNLGGINQFGEPFGLHLMDPIAAGSGAWASKDGVDAGGPITSPVASIADVERNEQVSPLFYFHRRLARDTGGSGKFRGGLTAEVSLTLGGIERAEALVMTHGAEVPNTMGLGGGWPGSTVTQSFLRGGVSKGRVDSGKWEVFGPKPGLMDMTSRDAFAVTWQGGGGWGDPLERDPEAVARDVAADWVSAAAAKKIYGVVLKDGKPNLKATVRARQTIRSRRVGEFVTDPARFCSSAPVASLSESLFIAIDARGTHVVTRAGCILATDSTRWRAGAVGATFDKLPKEYRIKLHADLSLTTWFCPATGTLLSVEVHERGKRAPDDLDVDVASLQKLCSEPVR
ncbi:MAG: hydantoinase B/oxoprolinase family protein [Betaproteobacteria bacterium]|nr:hydantoinase B/oxoprolinase family protein [Betaproteobacteria bacterium]